MSVALAHFSQFSTIILCVHHTYHIKCVNAKSSRVIENRERERASLEQNNDNNNNTDDNADDDEEVRMVKC